VKEKHTLDILFTELLFLLQWFNPFAWLIKGAVKNNLEYKTDDEIVKTNDPQTYQLAMVTLADKKGVAPFLTALNGSQLKSRIIMMKKKAENKFAPLKQMVLLPLLAVLVMGLSNREVKTEIIQQQNETVEIKTEMQTDTVILEEKTEKIQIQNNPDQTDNKTSIIPNLQNYQRRKSNRCQNCPRFTSAHGIKQSFISSNLWTKGKRWRNHNSDQRRCVKIFTR